MLLDKFASNSEYIVAAISGGVDSMCLLDMLIRDGYKVVCAHVNHNQREQSKIEKEYIENYCISHNIIFEYFDYKPISLENFQAVAHEKRYEFFYKCAKKYNAKYIVTAHHLDDQAETILLRLIKGSNLYGYGGISRYTKYKDVTIYRPMLNLSRIDILNYAKTNNIKYYEDSSNSEDHYMRNRIRHNILPLLKEENPNILETLSRFSTISKEAFNFIRSKSINYLNENNGVIYLDTFLELDIALMKDILALVLESNNVKANYNLIENILEIIRSYEPELDVSLPNSLIFKKRYNKCFIESNINTKLDEKYLNLEETVVYGKYRFTLSKTKRENNAKNIKICYNNLKLPLLIRSRKDGDFIKLKFGTKKLSRLFIDKKLTKEERESIPIITDIEGDVLVIYGLISSTLIKGDGEQLYLICEENYDK